MTEAQCIKIGKTLLRWRQDSERVYLNTDNMRLRLPIQVSLVVNMADLIEQESQGFEFDRDAWITGVLGNPFGKKRKTK
jgi:hypothetical protein